MTDIFIPQEIAKKLKEIGFEQRCIGAYDDYSMLHIINSNDKFSLSKSEIIAYAPTYEQTFKWFRDKGYHAFINRSEERECYIEIFIGNSNEDEIPHRESFYPTYEQARETLILKLIELYQTNSN